MNRIVVRFTLLALLAVAAFAVTSCGKGDTGPTGPRGDTGATGTANVIYSGWHTVSGATRDTTIDGSLLKYNFVSAPDFTQGVLDSCDVHVYMTFAGTTQVWPLPYTSFAGGKQNTISYVLQVGKFLVTRFTADNTASIGLSSSIQYRYVIIPGGVHGLAVRSTIDWNDYEEVRAKLGLRD